MVFYIYKYKINKSVILNLATSPILPLPAYLGRMSRVDLKLKLEDNRR